MDTTVCVMGMGYVGLTLSVSLASVGIKTFGVEINPDVVTELNNGHPHFHEQKMPVVLRQVLNKTLFVSTTIPKDQAISTFIISVGTPLLPGEKKPNINYIQQVIRDVAEQLRPGSLVILRSTVPVGTTRTIVIPLFESLSGMKAGKDFFVAFAPERTIEGKALIELRTNPQIVGGIDEESVRLASDLFRKITPTIITVSSLEAAEMIKIVDNTYRDVRFAFANDLALLCEKLNLDAHELITAANIHYPRNSVPLPSPGVGGACLSKDPHILINFAEKVGYTPRLIVSARQINEEIPSAIVNRIKTSLAKKGKSLETSKICIVGFAFKGDPETSDLRDSTTLWFLKALKDAGGTTIFGYDPIIEKKEIEKLGVMASTYQDGITEADVVCFMNNHPSYQDINVVELAQSMRSPAIIYDSWRLLDCEGLEEYQEITYMGVGK